MKNKNTEGEEIQIDSKIGAKIHRGDVILVWDLIEKRLIQFESMIVHMGDKEQTFGVTINGNADTAKNTSFYVYRPIKMVHKNATEEEFKQLVFMFKTGII